MIGRLLLVGAAAIALSACAAPARVQHMAASAAFGSAEPNADLVEAVCVAGVTGGEETNPLWTSEVDNAGFRAALQQSLRNNRLAAGNDGACRYDLEANLLGLAQPAVGFDMEVTSHVNYTVTDRTSGDPYFLTTVTAAHTAPFSDSFLAVERLRIANEGSIRRNIGNFITQLLDYTPDPPPVDETDEAVPST